MRKKFIFCLMLICFFSTIVIPISHADAKTFDCVVGKYTITYETSGELKDIKRTDGTPISQKSRSSYFKPTTEADCPNDVTAKVSIIDGGRTIYVARFNETFSQSKEPTSYGCLGLLESECRGGNGKVACVWNETSYGNYCNVDNLLYVGCGGATDIPYQVPQITSFAINLLKIATPIILIVVSIIKLVKSLTASEESEIKKAQKSLIKKLIASALVFFVISIVQFVIIKVADSTDQGGINACMNCLINNKCDKSIYYKTNVAGIDFCTTLGGKSVTCQ